jgi:hypothetical protein
MGTPKIPLVLDSAVIPWFDEEAAWGEEDDHRPQEVRTNSPAGLWCPSR